MEQLTPEGENLQMAIALVTARMEFERDPNFAIEQMSHITNELMKKDWQTVLGVLTQTASIAAAGVQTASAVLKMPTGNFMSQIAKLPYTQLSCEHQWAWVYDDQRACPGDIEKCERCGKNKEL